MSRVWRQGIIGWIIVSALFATGTPAASQSCLPPPEGLVSWWAADGNAIDSLGPNHGMIWNGVNFTDGLTARAFSFDGVNDYVEVADAASLNFTSALTIEAWVNPSSFSARYPAIVKKTGLKGGPSTTHGYCLEFIDRTPQVALSLYVENQWVSSPPATVPVGTNTWSHVVTTYDGAWIRMYLNGTEIGPATYQPGRITPSDNPLNIGRDPGYPSDPDRYFHGLMDEVRIYNRALTAGEIRTIYQARDAGVCANHPPKAICQDVTVSAGPACTASASIDNGSYDPEGDAIALTQSPERPYPLGSTLTTLTVTGGKGVVRQCEGTITVVDTTPPSLVPPPPLNLSLEPGNTACGLFVSDAQLGQATVGDNCLGGITITRRGVPADNLFPVGTTTITHTATDGAGNTVTATQTVTVIDPKVPEITDVSVSPVVLWPANGQMVEVYVAYNLITNCNSGPMACNLSVSSNQPIDGSDYSILDAHHLLLRAENKVKGSDRIYTVTITCSGGTGPELKRSTTVLVPDKKEKGGKKN